MPDMQPTTVIGGLTDAPELRYTSSDQPVANFRVAVNNGLDSEGNERPATFFNVTVWGARPGRDKAEFDQAINAAMSLKKGTRVMMVGRFVTEQYINRAGVEVRDFKFIADEVAPSLRWATAKVTKNQRNNPSGAVEQLELTDEDF